MFELDPAEAAAEFGTARPWPHLVVDDFLPVALLDEAVANIPDPATPDLGRMSPFQKSRLGDYEVRSTILPIRKLHPSINSVYDLLYGEEVCSLVQSLCGGEIVRGLDACLCESGDLRGAGVHQIADGGFMGVHRDPEFHHEKGWHRPVVGIIYLNKGLGADSGGGLELWDRECAGVVKRIEPKFNRLVLLSNGPTTYHGVSRVRGFTRKSFCAFYYDKSRQGAVSKYFFVNSSDVLIEADRISRSGDTSAGKRFAAEVFATAAKDRYPDFDSKEFYRLCGLI